MQLLAAAFIAPDNSIPVNKLFNLIDYIQNFKLLNKI